MEMLDRHFDVAFAAPEGIKKLRGLILTLAMQGKLVPQDPNDQPASELLQEIAAEKRRLVREGKIREPKSSPAVSQHEAPHMPPDGWAWVRLQQIGIVNPRNDVDEDSQVAGFVPMALIEEGYSGRHAFEQRPWREIKQGFTHFADGDIGMAKITPCFENAKSCIFAGLPSGVGAGTTELHVFRNAFGALIPRFLLYYLKNPAFIAFAALRMTGSAGQKRVPTALFAENPFPLPPLSEQERIVSRIDELMARCDALEKLRAERDGQRLAVHTAAVRKLLNVADPEDHNQAREFLDQHFGELYTVKENVAELRKAILQLAVMGKLVPQDHKDPPASELLKQIEAEKKRLVREGKIKASKPPEPIKPEELPFPLPYGWQWVRLERLTEVITKGSSPNWQGIRYVSEGQGILFVTSENVGSFKLLLGKKKYVEERFNQIEPRSMLRRRDILMNIVGASIGRTAIFDLDEIANINQAVTIIRLIAGLEHDYFLNFFNSPLCLRYMLEKQVENARPNLSMGSIARFLIPVPPNQEQRLIVAKIAQLTSFCDALEEQIDAASGKQSTLLDAMVAQTAGERCV